jgi:hypothetical protein
MMSGMPLETCWSFNKLWNNKFYYNVASCWLFLLVPFKKFSRKDQRGYGNIKATLFSSDILSLSLN